MGRISNPFSGKQVGGLNLLLRQRLQNSGETYNEELENRCA